MPKAVILTTDDEEDEEEEDGGFDGDMVHRFNGEETNILNHQEESALDMSRAARKHNMSRKSSHARGMGVSASRKSLLNRSYDISANQYDEELINPDEFEEIAEIYD